MANNLESFELAHAHLSFCAKYYNRTPMEPILYDGNGTLGIGVGEQIRDWARATKIWQYQTLDDP
jgi:hypothetical protein